MKSIILGLVVVASGILLAEGFSPDFHDPNYRKTTSYIEKGDYLESPQHGSSGLHKHSDKAPHNDDSHSHEDSAEHKRHIREAVEDVETRRGSSSHSRRPSHSSGLGSGSLHTGSSGLGHSGLGSGSHHGSSGLGHSGLGSGSHHGSSSLGHSSGLGSGSLHTGSSGLGHSGLGSGSHHGSSGLGHSGLGSGSHHGSSSLGHSSGLGSGSLHTGSSGLGHSSGSLGSGSLHTGSSHRPSSGLGSGSFYQGSGSLGHNRRPISGRVGTNIFNDSPLELETEVARPPNRLRRNSGSLGSGSSPRPSISLGFGPFYKGSIGLGHSRRPSSGGTDGIIFNNSPSKPETEVAPPQDQITLKDEEYTCLYSNVREKVENRRLECNHQSCRLTEMSDRHSSWNCGTFKCNLKNLDNSEDFPPGKLFECSEQRALIKAPSRCPPSHKPDRNGKCRPEF